MHITSRHVASHSASGDEQAAIALLKRRNIRGLELLVQQHQLRALRTAYLIVADRQAADDIVAEAFVRAYEQIDQFDAHKSFAPWFYRIVVNGALQWLRRNKHRHLSEDEFEWHIDPAPQPDECVAISETRDAIVNAIHALPSDQRTIVVLRFYLDMDERTIAETLKTPLGTVKWRMHEARKQLRKVLDASPPLQDRLQTWSPEKRMRPR